MTDSPGLEDRVAALEAAITMLTRKLLARGDITINDARAAHGLPPFQEQWANSPGHVQATARQGTPSAP